MEGKITKLMQFFYCIKDAAKRKTQKDVMFWFQKVHSKLQKQSNVVEKIHIQKRFEAGAIPEPFQWKIRKLTILDCYLH